MPTIHKPMDTFEVMYLELEKNNQQLVAMVTYPCNICQLNWYHEIIDIWMESCLILSVSATFIIYLPEKQTRFPFRCGPATIVSRSASHANYILVDLLNLQFNQPFPFFTHLHVLVLFTTQSDKKNSTVKTFTQTTEKRQHWL